MKRPNRDCPPSVVQRKVASSLSSWTSSVLKAIPVYSCDVYYLVDGQAIDSVIVKMTADGDL